jgi:hypothetical protein
MRSPPFGEETVMKRLVLVTLIALVVTVGLVAPASAIIFGFPDGNVSAVLPAGPAGTHVNLFWNLAGDPDIFVFNVDAFANPLLVPVLGPPAGAYWVNFVGFDGLGRFVFDVYANQGAGFFFVMRWIP